MGTKNGMSIVSFFLLAALVLIVLVFVPQISLAAEGEETVPETVCSFVLDDVDIMDIPTEAGAVIGKLKKCDLAEIYQTGVSDSWNALILEDGSIGYVPGHMVALTTEYTYEPMADLTMLCGFSGGQINKALEGTALHGLGDCFAKLEQLYAVNALFLVSIARLESANGTSTLAQQCNNLGGLKNGENGYMEFETREACLDYMAWLLKENYLSEDGACFHGKTTKDVSQKYCEGSVHWYTQIESLMEETYLKAGA